MKGFGIRSAKVSDARQIKELFYETVSHMSSEEYSPEQIRIWASSKNEDTWKALILEQNFLVADLNDKVIGFCSLTFDGYLDYLYIHKDHQRKTVAKLLMVELIQKAHELELKEIKSDVSENSMSFFEKQGFRALGKQIKESEFHNYGMVKSLA